MRFAEYTLYIEEDAADAFHVWVREQEAKGVFIEYNYVDTTEA